MSVPFDSLWLEMPESSEVAKFLEGPQPRRHELIRALRIIGRAGISASERVDSRIAIMPGSLGGA